MGGCKVEGYASDITTDFCARQSRRTRETGFDIVHRARARTRRCHREAECGSVDVAARKVIVDAGFGPDYKYFTHRLGHEWVWNGHGMALSGSRKHPETRT